MNKLKIKLLKKMNSAKTLFALQELDWNDFGNMSSRELFKLSTEGKRQDFFRERMDQKIAVLNIFNRF